MRPNKINQIFEGIYSDGKNIYTKNLLPKNRVYGEKLILINGVEYRQWDYYRSKYCAGLKNGLIQSIFFKGANVLYLGSAEGTTVSHVSDIVEKKGNVFCVDISEMAMMKIIKLAEKRGNIIPILENAQKVQNYSKDINALTNGKIDSLFQDISQKNQAEIFVKNAQLLRKGRLGAIALKTKSISQSMPKEQILANEKKILQKEFEILQTINLEPFEKHHYLILVKKK